MASESMNDNNENKINAESYAEELEKRVEMLRYELRHDALTKCCNKLSFDEDLDKILKSLQTEGTVYSVAAFSVDLRYVNEKEGRDHGDDALKYVAECLIKHFEYVYRIGGEKFNVITAGEWSRERLQQLCDSIISEYSGKAPLQVYAGLVSTAEDCGSHSTDMVEKAVERMYRDKREKDFKGRAMGYDDIKQRILADAVSLIPGTETENGMTEETVSTKFLSTMWFYIHSVSCMVGKEFHDIKFWVFPVRYVKPVVTMPSVVVMQVDNGEYCVKEGTNVSHFVDGKGFTLNCRIQRDGSFQSALIADDESINIISHEQEPHTGKYTPNMFGKAVIVEDLVYEVFPVRQNINGTCDCVIGTHSLSSSSPEGNFRISGGIEDIDGHKFSFVLSDDRFEVIID